MRFNSPIFYSLFLLAFCYVLLGKIDISFIFFSIALIENSLSLRFYPVSRRVSDQNDFRFSYAEVASKIYYPISLIVSYLIYIFIINFHKDNSSFEVIYLLITLSLFTIFRIAINEILNYLENKNPIKNKNIIDMKVVREIRKAVGHIFGAKFWPIHKYIHDPYETYDTYNTRSTYDRYGT